MTFFKTQSFKEQGAVEGFTRTTATGYEDNELIRVFVQWYVRGSDFDLWTCPSYLLPLRCRNLRCYLLPRYRHLHYLLATTT